VENIANDYEEQGVPILPKKKSFNDKKE